MTEAYALILGVAFSILLARWIYQHRNPEQGRPRSVSAAAVERLRTMFPNIPESVIRAELVRAGSMPAAVERLLSLSSNYATRPLPAHPSSVNNQGAFKVTHEEILKSLQTEEDDAASCPSPIDTSNWTSNPTLRESILIQRKKKMLQNARQ